VAKKIGVAIRGRERDEIVAAGLNLQALSAKIANAQHKAGEGQLYMTTTR